MTGPLKSLTPLTATAREKLEMALWWAAPPLVIPVLRWLQDPPEVRNKLFIRDFSTYSLGAAIFFLAKSASEGILRHRINNPQTVLLLGSVIGLGANLLYAGIGALQLSKWIERVNHSAPVPHPQAADFVATRHLPTEHVQTRPHLTTIHPAPTFQVFHY